MIAITGISAKKGDTFSCRIKALEVRFSPLSLFTKKFPEIVVKNARLEVDSRDKKLKDAAGYPAFKPGKGFTAKSVIISNLNLVLNTSDWETDVTVDGNIEIRKTPAGGTEIEANFRTIASTGKLAIRDGAFLKKLSEAAKQPPAAIEDLKDFDLTKGSLQISGKQGSLSSHVTLEGAKVKKDLIFPLSGL